MKVQDMHSQSNSHTRFDSLKEKFQKGDINGKIISETYLFEYTQKIAIKSTQTFETQRALFDFKKIQEMLDKLDTKSLGYEGKSLSELNVSEAAALIGDQGFFGITKTSDRLIDFVLAGAGSEMNLLKAGRSGMAQGFKEAESMWGEKLPEISYRTMEKVFNALDDKIASLGGNLLDMSV